MLAGRPDLPVQTEQRVSAEGRIISVESEFLRCFSCVHLLAIEFLLFGWQELSSIRSLFHREILGCAQ